MNIQKMMQQAQKMQEKMQETQEKLGQEKVEGTAGGGSLKVIMSCKGEVSGIEIDDELFKDGDKSIIEDLMVAAFNDAKKKSEEKMNEELSKITGEMGLPSGFKFPM